MGKSLAVTMVFAALLPAAAGAADGSAVPGIPPEATVLYQKLSLKVPPNARPIIAEAALKLRRGTIQVSTAGGGLDALFSSAGLSGMDVSEAAFLAVMQAFTEMNADLKALMEETKALAAAREKLRETIGNVGRDVGRHAGKNNAEICSPPSCGGYQGALTELRPVLRRVRGVSPLVLREPADIGQLRRLEADLKIGLQGMDEMLDEVSGRMQNTLARHSAIILTLREIMRRFSDSQSTVIQKMK